MITYAKKHHDWHVGRLARWKRRSISIPVALLSAIVLWALSPLLLLVATAVDLAEGWRRRRWLRVFGFALGFATLEFIAITYSVLLWFVTGFGFLLHHHWAQELHRHFKVWWANWVLRLIRKCMATKVHIEGDKVVPPGPIVTIARHISMGDAVLPIIILGKRHGFEMRYTLKNDLVWVPALDIYGHRLPNYFVDRDPTHRDRELEPIRNLARGIGEKSSGVVFPEGTFRTPERFERALARIALNDPRRAERVNELRHLLPARGGGTLAMLEGAPDADIVVLTHVGFEKFHTFKEILAHIPFDRDIQIGVWRIARSEVPTDPDAQLQWLDEQWQRVDDWVEEKSNEPSRGGEGADDYSRADTSRQGRTP